MSKRSKSKKNIAEISETQEQTPKPPFRERMKSYWGSAAQTMAEFREQDARTFGKWLAIYFIVAFCSLFLLNSNAQLHLDEFPIVLALLAPRMFTLFLFTCPVFYFKKRKSAFLLMTAFWQLWYCIAFGSIKRGAALFIILAILAVLLFLAERPNLSVKHRPLFRKLMVLLLLTLFSVFVLQMAQMRSLVKPFSTFLLHPDILACNMMCFAALGSFVFWVRRPKVALSSYGVIWATLAVISYCKSRNTFEPVLFLDVFSVREGLRAFFSFFSWFFIIGICVLIVLAIAGIVFLALKEKKKPFSLLKLITASLFVVLVFCSVFYMSKLSALSSESKTAKSEYDTKGFVYSFLFYSIDSFVAQPDGYDPTVIQSINQKIEEEYAPYGAGASNVQNVIVIQLESFADPYDFPGIVLQEDPMPFIHSLMNDYSSGYVSVPVFGGLTVKSEFEFITGLSIENLPLGYNPYVQYVYENPMDSIARYFHAEGYETTAIHNYQGEFFQRDQVYKNLGFDYFIPYECMPDIIKNPDRIWGNDDVFVNHIAQALDHNGDRKNFIYGITVQTHGNYDPIPKEEYTMEIGGIRNATTEGAMAYYIQQLQQVDEMVKNLVAELSERDEATYVLFYGDHLPSLFGESEKEISNEQKYSTPYFTWNNMGIPKAEKESRSEDTPNYIPDIELYQLSTFLCRELKLDGSYMNRFHSVFPDTQAAAQEFSSIEYYKMYDEKNTVDFSNENYTVGLVPLTVTEIRESEDDDDSYVIKGTGFTSDTFVCLNNKTVYEVEFIDENTILLQDVPDAILPDDWITVRILGEKVGTILKESESYEWGRLIR